ncbi:hypothetical protein ACS0TY_022440 [Phlomoides rotata]
MVIDGHQRRTPATRRRRSRLSTEIVAYYEKASKAHIHGPKELKLLWGLQKDYNTFTRRGIFIATSNPAMFYSRIQLSC